MVSRCENLNLCPDGNCIGCNDSKLWCVDPRCTPACQGCAGNSPLEPVTPAQTQPFDIGKPPVNNIATWKIVVAIVAILAVAILLGMMVWFLSYKYSDIPTQKEEQILYQSSAQPRKTVIVSTTKQPTMLPSPGNPPRGSSGLYDQGYSQAVQYRTAPSVLPITHQSVIQQPMTQQPMTQQPVPQQSVIQQPMTQQTTRINLTPSSTSNLSPVTGSTITGF